MDDTSTALRFKEEMKKKLLKPHTRLIFPHTYFSTCPYAYSNEYSYIWGPNEYSSLWIYGIDKGSGFPRATL